jgi:hypothetical protein
MFAACVDTASHKKDTAKFCADLIRKGHQVERVTCDVVRSGPWTCPACHPPKTAELFKPITAHDIMQGAGAFDDDMGQS